MTDPKRQIVRKSTLADQGNGEDKSLHIVPDVFVDLACTAFRSAECYERRRLVGSLTGTTADDVQFEEGCFLSVDLSKTRWQHLLLRRTRLEKCDLANARWTKAVLEATEFHKCRGTGLQFVDLKSNDSVFRYSKLNLAAFHGSQFRNVRFKGCNLREANFESVKFVDVVFRNCDLRLARFPNCVMKKVDFRGSQLAGMQVEPAMLRGACVGAAQLLDLATIFGLDVQALDDDEIDSMKHSARR